MLLKPSLCRNWKHSRWKSTEFRANFLHNPRKPRSDVVSWNILISDHLRKGEIGIARQLFDEMPQRSSVSWNTMISGYAKCGRIDEALGVVSEMHRGDAKLNESSFSSVLSVCSRSNCFFYHGIQIHCLVLKSGFECFDYVGSSLLNFYGSCFKIDCARRVFEILRHKNVLLWSLMVVGYVRCNLMENALKIFRDMPTPRHLYVWTALISGYTRSEGECEKALDFFRLMRESGEAEPNEFTLDSVIRACGRLGDLNRGKTVHGCLIRFGFESDYSICGALIDFYCKCDSVDDARKLYYGLVNPCLNASNSLIGGFISIGRMEDAEMIFKGMVELNPISCNLMVKGYALEGRINDSKSLFERMPHRTLVSSNTMISAYCRNGELSQALNLFEGTKGEYNTVTWNSMISGFVQNEQHEEALKLYINMQRLSIERNRSTFSVLFRACSGLGTLLQGKLLHAHVSKTPFESNVYVGTSLIDMYAKCGSISDAQNSFFNIRSPNVAAWTAMINGYAHHGFGIKAITLFEQMLEQGIDPNVVTFVGLLLACGRAGLVDDGLRFFHSMEKDYGLVPTLEHYACVVDLLGRSGYLREAEEFVNGMPIDADHVVWGALLSACWYFMDVEVGERVAKRMLCLDAKQTSTYVILSNIYAGAGKWDGVVRLRKRLRGMEVKKDPGCSWIEVKNSVNVFSVEYRNHPQSDEIYAILEEVRANTNSSFEFEYGP